MITYAKDFITITAIALDCSNSLTDASFANPAALSYDTANPTTTIAASYLDIFTQTLEADCVIQDCRLMDVGCLTALPT